MMIWATPCFFSSSMVSSRRSVAITERLAVGSSRITTRGSNEIARAIATDCWRPPDRLSTFW